MRAPQSPAPLLVEIPIRIKTYDIDFVGHVNNIVYVRWLEDLRLQFLDAYLPLDGLLASEVVPIIVGTQIHYRQPILLKDQNVTGRMWVDGLEKATFHLAAEFVVRDEARCTARQRGAFISTRTHRPVRIPQALRNQYEG